MPPTLGSAAIADRLLGTCPSSTVPNNAVASPTAPPAAAGSGRAPATPAFRAGPSRLLPWLVVVAAAGYWWMNRPPGRYKPDNSGLYPINVDGKYGFMDRSGKTVITPQFDWDRRVFRRAGKRAGRDQVGLHQHKRHRGDHAAVRSRHAVPLRTSPESNLPTGMATSTRKASTLEAQLISGRQSSPGSLPPSRQQTGRWPW
jgi:hypothetical protein